MQDDGTRINHCLGNGLGFNGQLTPRLINRKIVAIDLPHFEFTLLPVGIVNGQIQCQAMEWDRHISAFSVNESRMVLWGGYHRVHALLCQLAGEAAGGAPLITVMTGMPDVVKFLAEPSFVRDTVLGDRPALLRDFLDEELFIEVNLRKRRAQGRVEILRPGKFRTGILHVNDNA
jgi:hypothetical protein